VNTYIPAQEHSQVPPPLPTPERWRLRTETSATAGWAARLAALFPDSAEDRKPAPKR
jgi:hypothetical protein